MKNLILILVVSASCLAQTHTFPALDTSNTWSGTNDFSNVPLMRMRVAAALTTSISGDCGFDTTANNWHCWNGVDSVIPLVPAASLPGNGQVATFSVSSGKLGMAGSSLSLPNTISLVSHNFLTSYNQGTGNFTQAQPSCADLSNAAPSCSTDATNAANISSGTLPSARLPNPSASALGGVESISAVTHNFLTSISTSGVPAQAQPSASDLSNGVTGSGSVVLAVAPSLNTPSLASPLVTGTASGTGTLPVGMLVPGTNGQCVNASGGSSVWGSCAGTAGVQLIGGPNTTLVNVNSSTTSVQTLQSACASSPCYSAGTLNSVGKTFDFETWGQIDPVNTTEKINLEFQLASEGFESFDGTSSAGIVLSSTGGAFFYAREVCVVTTSGSSGAILCNGSIVLEDGNGKGFVQANGFRQITSFNLTSTAVTPTFGVAFGTASSSNIGSSYVAMTHQHN